MGKACIFPHYFNQNYIPQYVCIFVNELSNYFEKIVIVTNKRPLKNRLEIESDKINILEVENEGYDFGMFYKGYQTIKSQNFETIACINDSNILFGSLKPIFDWAANLNVDFWGLMDANIRPHFSTHQNNYHIGSHFLVFNKAAILLFEDYFDQLNLEAIFDINDPQTVKMRIINDWEIGVTQFLISKGLACNAYIRIDEIEQKLGLKIKNEERNTINTSIDLYAEVIKSGVPILKKRIITSAKPKHILIYKNNWIRLIKKYGDSNWNLQKLLKNLKAIRNTHFSNNIRKIFQ